MDLPSHMRHLQTHSPLQFAANVDSLSAIPRNVGQLCHTEELDITREIALSRSQDLALTHSPTFFGPLPVGRQYSQNQLNSPERRGNMTPQRSPRLHSLESLELAPQSQMVMPEERGHHCNLWKPQDIASLEHELAQLRFAAEALPSLSNLARTPERLRQRQAQAQAPPSPRSITQPGGGSPQVSNPEPSWLTTAMQRVEVAHHGSGGYSCPSSPRRMGSFNTNPSPEFGITSKASPDFGKSSPSRSPEFGNISQNDSPNQAFEPEVTATSRTQLELNDALGEVEKLKHALQKANQEIATLREEKKASEAAHSRDVAALATLLQQVTAEKARALAHNGHRKDHHESAKHGKIEKSVSSLTTDDTWSVAASEASSDPDRDRSFGTLVASLVQK